MIATLSNTAILGTLEPGAGGRFTPTAPKRT
jgi:hypothetical protein